MLKRFLINSINPETKKKPVGSGLGLAICKQIIEHHKGKFGMKKILTGATFILHYPIIIQQKIIKMKKFNCR
jgi:signal transduction histidine kinase